MIRVALVPGLALLALVSGGFSPQAAPGEIDLLAKGLDGWKRTPIPPDKEVVGRELWVCNPARGLLYCTAKGPEKEMLLYDKEFTDGVFHVEWRFRKQEGEKPVYNGGVYVRASADGQVWHQAQVAVQDKPPRVGDLFGMTKVGSEVKRVEVPGVGPDRMKPVGEWNVFDIECRGKTITLKVNGDTTAVWKDCEVTSGRIGLQAEFAPIEFRNLKYRPLP